MINPLIYFLLFLKATLFSSGGLSNLPSLRQDLTPLGWAHDSDFGEAVAIGQISPGPNGLWAISLGYLTYGPLGALLAFVAIMIPSFLVLVIAELYGHIQRQPWVPGLMRGITLAVVAIQIAVSWAIIEPMIKDWHTWLIVGIATGLAIIKRVPLLMILGLAGLLGFFFFR
jgi:chromate transporter